jgi:type VI secretion system secreted protein Hcp
MAVDMFLKLDGIPGESTDAKHKDEIVLESFSWGEANTGHGAAGGGGGAGKVSMQDFHFTAKLNKATPLLMLHCANGNHIKTGVFTVRKAGVESKEGGFEFLTYKFNGVTITSVQEAGAAADYPLDSVSFAFQKIDVTYKPQLPDGAAGPPVEFAWDLLANKKF